MIEKECGVIDGAKFPSLWQASSGGYRHTVTGARERQPQPVRGGVLADVSAPYLITLDGAMLTSTWQEMGLGETLTTLALICWYLDLRDSLRLQAKESNRTKTTLIVVPKSSE